MEIRPWSVTSAAVRLRSVYHLQWILWIVPFEPCEQKLERDGVCLKSQGRAAQAQCSSGTKALRQGNSRVVVVVR